MTDSDASLKMSAQRRQVNIKQGMHPCYCLLKLIRGTNYMYNTLMTLSHVNPTTHKP